MQQTFNLNLTKYYKNNKITIYAGGGLGEPGGLKVPDPGGFREREVPGAREPEVADPREPEAAGFGKPEVTDEPGVDKDGPVEPGLGLDDSEADLNEPEAIAPGESEDLDPADAPD